MFTTPYSDLVTVVSPIRYEAGLTYFNADLPTTVTETHHYYPARATAANGIPINDVNADTLQYYSKVYNPGVMAEVNEVFAGKQFVPEFIQSVYKAALEHVLCPGTPSGQISRYADCVW